MTELEKYTDRELKLELCRRYSQSKNKDTFVSAKCDDEVELSPFGAWRSFYGQMVFDYDRDCIYYRGLLLPTLHRHDEMEFQSVYAEKKSVTAAGWQYV